MSKYFITLRLFHQTAEHHVWVGENLNILDFINEMTQRWSNDNYSYQHGLYLQENESWIDVNKTFKEVGVVSGDHLIIM